jgi:hypothetical protein
MYQPRQKLAAFTGLVQEGRGRRGGFGGGSSAARGSGGTALSSEACDMAAVSAVGLETSIAGAGGASTWGADYRGERAAPFGPANRRKDSHGSLVRVRERSWSEGWAGKLTLCENPSHGAVVGILSGAE